MTFQLFFRNKIQDEEGYVLFVRKNALQILIPKYGLEGTLYLVPATGQPTANFVYNEEVRTLSIQHNILINVDWGSKFYHEYYLIFIRCNIAGLKRVMRGLKAAF